MKYSIAQIKDVMKKKGYKFFDTGILNLNIIGVRSMTSQSNEFDDLLYVIYRDSNGQQIQREFTITTDPGKPFLLNPLAGTGGTAILVPGQYPGAYMVGIHGRSRPSGGYKALEQRAPMKYVRDNNRNALIDFNLYSNPANIFVANLKTNIHRASQWSVVRFIEKYSAGCQVFRYPKSFDWFMDICEQSAKIYGNKFTYTLLEERDFIS